MKILLTPAPTFTATVPIHVPGQGRVDVEWTFRHMNKDDVAKFQKRAADKKISDVDYILEVASGWELDEDFTKKNLSTFLSNYPAAAAEIIRAWAAELTGARTKN